MDNARIHHLERVQDLITEIGTELLSLQPKPDALGESLCQSKGCTEKANDNLYLATPTPELMIKLAFATVTPTDAL